MVSNAEVEAGAQLWFKMNRQFEYINRVLPLTRNVRTELSEGFSALTEKWQDAELGNIVVVWERLVAQEYE